MHHVLPVSYTHLDVYKRQFIEWIYSALQVPLQGLSDSLPGAIGIALFISLLWWFGVHRCV